MSTVRAGRRLKVLLLALIGVTTGQGLAHAADDTLTVAVASNFAAPMGELAQRLEAATGNQVTVVPGSTGKHYAQIVHGAPFDLFFGADEERPRRLEQDGLAVSGTRFTYALGRLVLWSPHPERVDSEGRVLEAGQFRHLALANPRLAPYGRAARQTLERLRLSDTLIDKWVMGENVAQAFQMVATGNAELGFVALSQLQQPGRAIRGSQWPVPAALHDPIEQQVVLVRDSPAARAFLEYVQTTSSRELIESFGYGAPVVRPAADRTEHAVR